MYIAHYCSPNLSLAPFFVMYVHAHCVSLDTVYCMYMYVCTYNVYRCVSLKIVLCIYKMCIYSTKNTILKKYDGRFKDIFEEIYER